MRLISFYLPQFHEIPENNDAWGNGFTEWTNVRRGVKYYDWQIQPRIPLDDNYYNLLDINTLRWQSKVANQYGVDGFCFYHYWFNGRMVLEKPIEILLKNTDINIQFCFSWANESWTKTWHGAGGNKEILIPQTYGGQEEWEKHLQYFIRFFRDERYIKKDGKPMLLVYRLRNIPEFNQMIKYWKNRVVEEGFPGLFLVSMNTLPENVHMSKWVDGSVDFEPNKTKYEVIQNAQIENNMPTVLDYQMMADKMLSHTHKENHFRTVYVNFDDTVRRKEKGICVKGSSPDRFGNLLKESVELSKTENNEFLFINAWNEWGEGNYLEPDTEYEYAYLEKLSEVIKSTE